MVVAPCMRRSVKILSERRRGFAAGEQWKEQQPRKKDPPQQEELWQDLFSNPSLWWDNRHTKTNPAYPDFRHRISRHALWLDNRQKPVWVDSLLPSLHQDHHYHAHHQDQNAHQDTHDTLNYDHHVDDNQQLFHHVNDGSHHQQPSRAHYAPGNNFMAQLSSPEHLSEAMDALTHLHKAASTGTYMSLLKACINIKSLFHAKQVYAHLVGSNVPLTGVLGDYLVVTLVKCGAIHDALEIWATLLCRTVYSWTAIISLYTEHGHGQEALELYSRMLEDGVEPNQFTFFNLFQACGSVSAIEQGKKLHEDACRRRFICNLFVGNIIVSMYVKCSAIKQAEDVFSGLLQRDIVSWNTMLSAYVEQGQAEKVLRLYRQMQEDWANPDRLTYVSVLQACISLAGKENSSTVEGCPMGVMSLEIGRAVHADAGKRCQTWDIVLGTTLVNMYGKCGSIAEAEAVFCALPHRDTVAWNAMIAAFVEQGHDKTALHMYVCMQRQGVVLDEVTYIYSLQVCSELGSMEICNQLHFDVVCAGCDSVQSMDASLIQAYRRCASMLDAQSFFDVLSEPDYVSWSTCISGHAGNGSYVTSLHMFEHLELMGVEPDEILFTAVLLACSHAGLIYEGLEYFESLCTANGMNIHLKHYGIMLDLLGRAGVFKGVEIFLRWMPMQADLSIWLSLLGACRMHGHVELAKHAYDHVMRLQPQLTFAYILMANIYMDAGLQDGAEDVGACMQPVHNTSEDELYTSLL